MKIKKWHREQYLWSKDRWMIYIKWHVQMVCMVSRSILLVSVKQLYDQQWKLNYFVFRYKSQQIRDIQLKFLFFYCIRLIYICNILWTYEWVTHNLCKLSGHNVCYSAFSPLFLPDPKDGSLYVLRSSDREALKKLPFTIPQLVASSPCRSSDGILYTGIVRIGWMYVIVYTVHNIQIKYWCCSTK